MNLFPDLIKLKVINEKENKPVPNIAVRVFLFARHKNNYSFIPSLSNQEGIIKITKEWLNKEIDETRNMFMMDYSSTLDDCLSKIEINFMDKTDIERTIKAMNMFKKVLNTPQKEIDDMSKVDNEKYKPLSKTVEFTEPIDTLEIELKINEISST